MLFAAATEKEAALLPWVPYGSLSLSVSKRWGVSIDSSVYCQERGYCGTFLGFANGGGGRGRGLQGTFQHVMGGIDLESPSIAMLMSAPLFQYLDIICKHTLVFMNILASL